MKKRKDMIILLFALLLIVIMIYLFFPQLYIKIVSDDVEKLESATVIVNDKNNEQPLCVIEIKEKVELHNLYAKIKTTSKIKVYRYPRHSVVESASPRYEIQFFYRNGKVDRFGTSENPQMVYRRLENDDNGYIIGQNNDLLEYVLYLAGETQGDGSARDTRHETRGRFYCLDKLSVLCYNFVEVIGYAKITKTKKR